MEGRMCNVVVISESEQETCFVICAVILPLLQELCQVSNKIYDLLCLCTLMKFNNKTV